MTSAILQLQLFRYTCSLFVLAYFSSGLILYYYKIPFKHSFSNVFYFPSIDGSPSPPTSLVPFPWHIRIHPFARHSLLHLVLPVPRQFPQLHKRVLRLALAIPNYPRPRCCICHLCYWASRRHHVVTQAVSHQEQLVVVQCSSRGLDQRPLLGN